MDTQEYKYQIPRFDSKTKKFDNIVLWLGFGLALILAVALFFIGLNQPENAKYKIELRDVAAMMKICLKKALATF